MCTHSIKTCCGHSLESPGRGDSNVYPQHMFLWRNKKKYPLIITKYPPYLFHSVYIPRAVVFFRCSGFFHYLKLQNANSLTCKNLYRSSLSFLCNPYKKKKYEPLLHMQKAQASLHICGVLPELLLIIRSYKQKVKRKLQPKRQTYYGPTKELGMHTKSFAEQHVLRAFFAHRSSYNS